MKNKLKSIFYIIVPFFCLIIIFYIFIGLVFGSLSLNSSFFDETVIVEETKIEIRPMTTIFYIKCNSTIRTDYFKITNSALTRTTITNGTILIIRWQKGVYHPFPFFQPKIRYQIILITIIDHLEVLN